jgi:predicted HD superfamily hydrolase involved in NAD metabolism
MPSMHTLKETDYTNLEEIVKRSVSESRFKHSLLTLKVAVRLAQRFSVDCLKAKIAAVWHDYAREWSCDQILTTVLQSNRWQPQNCELENPMLLHGAAAALELEKNIPYIDDDILLAIRWHTVGSVKMGRLGYIIYTADFIEESRKHITRYEKARLEGLDSPEAMVFEILDDTIPYLSAKRKTIAESTLILHHQLRKELMAGYEK